MSIPQDNTSKRPLHSVLLDIAAMLFSAFTICLIIINLFSADPPFPRKVAVYITLIWGIGAVALLYIAYSAADRLRKQQKLLSENEKLLMEAEKEKMRANLLRAVSHDLRTPLTGIIGNCLAYLESKDKLSDKEKEDLVRFVYEDSTWLINMVENLLTVTRIREEGIRINLQDESLEEIIGEALMKIEKRHANAEVSVTIPPEFILLPMDALLIEQVLINLIENALFHSGSKDPIELLVENQVDCVSFTIRDYGEGIPVEKLSHLFEGSDYSTFSSDSQKGIGIGLIICKTIIHAHGGTIIGRNHENGAEFVFTLPKKRPD